LLATGTVAQIGYARMLMLLPVSVVGQAVATAALPALSQLASEGRREQLDRTLLRILQPSLMLAAVLAAGVWVLAEPGVALVFERGAFTAQDTQRVAAILSVLCFGIPGWVVQQVAGRGYYAREDMWRPMFLSTAVALLAIPLYLALGRGFGAQGIAAAGALAMSASALVMLVGLRLLHGGPALAPLAGTLLRGVAVALPAAAAGDWAAGLAQAPLVSCLQGGVVFMIIAIPSTWILGDEVTQEILRGLARRIARSRGA
jgi:putative peptidoglycan lipid II flippase